MIPINLNLLTIPRLKAYRKSLYKKINPYEVCWCGDTSCDREIQYSRKNPKYIFLKDELERTNIELGARQRALAEKERKKKWAENVWVSRK